MVLTTAIRHRPIVSFFVNLPSEAWANHFDNRRIGTIARVNERHYGAKACRLRRFIFSMAIFRRDASSDRHRVLQPRVQHEFSNRVRHGRTQVISVPNIVGRLFCRLTTTLTGHRYPWHAMANVTI